ncbi:MAG: DUF116 domain-containing protein [Deltaproteobacteria bacterium]|nr:DUF116 domain-containing protein [Deltaproteobacteria bacterium]
MKQGRSLIDIEEEWRGSSESIPYKPGNGIFLGLLAFSTLITIGAGFFFWYIPTVGLGNIHPLLPILFGVAITAVSILLLGGVIALTLVVKGKNIPFSPYKVRGILIKVFLPLMVLVGGGLRVPRIRVEQAFIEINNQLVKSMRRWFKPEKILVLLPHCIQYVDCGIKVTQDVRNCVGCGKCEIKDLIRISDEFGIDLFVSTGGTIARKKVYEKRPDAVVAVACERDLTSGIQDAYPLPVLGIVNKRPQGYCIGTGVDVAQIQEALRGFLG